MSHRFTGACCNLDTLLGYVNVFAKMVLRHSAVENFSPGLKTEIYLSQKHVHQVDQMVL